MARYWKNIKNNILEICPSNVVRIWKIRNKSVGDVHFLCKSWLWSVWNKKFLYPGTSRTIVDVNPRKNPIGPSLFMTSRMIDVGVTWLRPIPPNSVNVCIRHLTSSVGQRARAAKKAAKDPDIPFCTNVIWSKCTRCGLSPLPLNLLAPGSNSFD